VQSDHLLVLLLAHLLPLALLELLEHLLPLALLVLLLPVVHH